MITISFPLFQQSWSPLQLVLTEHTYAVNSMAFSPDGKVLPLVRMVNDITVSVQDIVSGVEILLLLRGPEDSVLTVIIPPTDIMLLLARRTGLCECGIWCLVLVFSQTKKQAPPLHSPPMESELLLVQKEIFSA